jgi:hypothetical protein
MATVQRYSKAAIYVNSLPLTEESNVTVKREDGGNAVKTVAKGYSGRSPGAPMTMITVKNAVPSADFEFNPGPFMNNTEPVEVTVFAAGRTLTVSGFIISDNFQHGVDAAAELEFEFEGGASDWE